MLIFHIGMRRLFEYLNLFLEYVKKLTVNVKINF